MMEQHTHCLDCGSPEHDVMYHKNRKPEDDKVFINNKENKMTKLTPLGNRVLVKLDILKEQRKSKGGIYMPESINKSPILTGTVIEIGPGRTTDKGVFIPVTNVKPGDKILFGIYAGADIDEPLGWEEFQLVKDVDILAKIEETEEPTYSIPVSDCLSDEFKS